MMSILSQSSQITCCLMTAFSRYLHPFSFARIVVSQLAISSYLASVISLIKTSLANQCEQVELLLLLNMASLPPSFNSWVTGLRMPFSYTFIKAPSSFRHFFILPNTSSLSALLQFFHVFLMFFFFFKKKSSFLLINTYVSF